MGKHNNKSLLNFKAKSAPKLSKFNAFAENLHKAREKKQQKLQQTKQRVLSNKYAIKGRIPKGNKANKFSLMDNENEQYRLTHKGKLVAQLNNFQDMQFGIEQSDQELRNAHQEMQFDGFENEQNGDNNSKKPKTQAEVYKEIIQKSKKYKMQRQRQYEQNFEAAVQLDQKFQDVVSNLKFLSQSSKMRQQQDNKDIEYERLLKEMQNQERVVPQKNIQKRKKESENQRKKKIVQLNELLKNDSQSEDIRGWVNQQSSAQDGEQDQIDDIELSQEDQQDQEDQEDQGQENQQEEGQDQEDQVDAEQSQDQEQPQQSLNDGQESDANSSQQSEVIVIKKKKIPNSHQNFNQKNNQIQNKPIQQTAKNHFKTTNINKKKKINY